MRKGGEVGAAYREDIYLRVSEMRCTHKHRRAESTPAGSWVKKNGQDERTTNVGFVAVVRLAKAFCWCLLDNCKQDGMKLPAAASLSSPGRASMGVIASDENSRAWFSLGFLL